MSDENQQDVEITEENTAPDPVVTEPVVEPTPEPAPAPVPPPTPKPPKQPSATLNKPKTPVNQAIVDALEDYLKVMAVGRSHSGNEGEAAQKRFYRTIQAILRMDGPNFTSNWAYLLEVVNTNREGVFNERYVYRYFNQMPSLSIQERKNFERVVNLIITTCNPATRGKTTKQVDIKATMDGFKDPEAQQKVIGFYTTI